MGAPPAHQAARSSEKPSFRCLVGNAAATPILEPRSLGEGVRGPPPRSGPGPGHGGRAGGAAGRGSAASPPCPAPSPPSGRVPASPADVAGRDPAALPRALGRLSGKSPGHLSPSPPSPGWRGGGGMREQLPRGDGETLPSLSIPFGSPSRQGLGTGHRIGGSGPGGEGPGRRGRRGRGPRVGAGV